MNLAATVQLPAKVRKAVDAAPRQVQKAFWRMVEAVRALDAAPSGAKPRTARLWARRLSLRPATIWNRRSLFRKHGYIALLDKRYSVALWTPRASDLPAPAAAWLRGVAKCRHLTFEAAIRFALDRLDRWQSGEAAAAIPGYSIAPTPGQIPPGWSNRNLRRVLRGVCKARPRVVARFTVTVFADGTKQIVDAKICRV